jgi:excisionase family DNA binding protein
MEEKFFTIEELAKYVNIPKSTIYKLSQKKEIPSIKIGKQLRFRKSSLDAWVSEKESGLKNLISEVSPKPKKSKVKLQSKHILLVDDDQLVLKTISNLLETRGYEVEAMNSGEEAIQKSKNANFDLLITDIRMPGIDGIETIKRIRQISREKLQPHIPEIVITGYIDTDAQTEASSLGITDYIYKPFVINEFLKTVENKISTASEWN